uniref:Uncharacterized protein n=1 Tax=Leersia perrieri TaxID=77586 RepID=A0A0D9WYF7_9ORYZ
MRHGIDETLISEFIQGWTCVELDGVDLQEDMEDTITWYRTTCGENNVKSTYMASLLTRFTQRRPRCASGTLRQRNTYSRIAPSQEDLGNRGSKNSLH